MRVILSIPAPDISLPAELFSVYGFAPHSFLSLNTKERHIVKVNPDLSTYSLPGVLLHRALFIETLQDTIFFNIMNTIGVFPLVESQFKDFFLLVLGN